VEVPGSQAHWLALRGQYLFQGETFLRGRYFHAGWNASTFPTDIGFDIRQYIKLCRCENYSLDRRSYVTAAIFFCQQNIPLFNLAACLQRPTS
jgi:hypothetical protein